MSTPDGEGETLAIPDWLRKAVDERDGQFCRMCGKYLGLRRAIHHINFGGDAQGMGGRRHHVLENVISLCWLPYDNDCHQRAHSRKAYWQKYLTLAITSPLKSTAVQLARWDARRSTP